MTKITSIAIANTHEVAYWLSIGILTFGILTFGIGLNVKVKVIRYYIAHKSIKPSHAVFCRMLACTLPFRVTPAPAVSEILRFDMFDVEKLGRQHTTFAMIPFDGELSICTSYRCFPNYGTLKIWAMVTRYNIRNATANT